MDEVNLLDDGIVDLILDSAAGGINTVEREGISVVHPAKFIMIGSGNPSVRVLMPSWSARFQNFQSIYHVKKRLIETLAGVVCSPFHIVIRLWHSF